ncbi:MAG: hypothetical protein WBI07_17955 [Mobilitalea sp.]
MEWKMNLNAINQISKGTDIYTEGEAVSSVAMVVKGRVTIHNDGAKITVGSGSFLGINDLYLGRFNSNYTACDDLVLYVFEISRVEEIDTILSVNKDYHGFMVASFYKTICELDQIYQSLSAHSARICRFLTETYQDVTETAQRRGYQAITSEKLSELKLAENDYEILRERIDYYIECKNLPIDVVKSFYSFGNTITRYQIEDQVNIVNQQIDILKEMAEDFIIMAKGLVDDTDSCLFQIVAKMAVERDNTSTGNDDLMDVSDSIIEEVNQAETLAERMLGRRFTVDRKRMEEAYHLMLSGNKSQEVSTETYLRYSKAESENAIEEMKNSFHKILGYAGIETSKAEEMEKLMLDYVYLKDKLIADDGVRLMRRKLADHHYEIYKSVFVKAYIEKTPPRIITMFLKYGFADERLLTKEQCLSLYFLKEDEKPSSLCQVYDIKAWLTLIYEGKKEPSKNEFDQEYQEMVNTLRKQGSISDKEAQDWMINPQKKLDYEIANMFRYNNRTANGQISSFVPFLHETQWVNNIEKLFVTPSKINSAIEEILKIDYSVFDRELLYVNQEKKIVKEYVIKKVFPDIILMPTVGGNGVMWQEIAAKRRDSAARFLLPIFTDVNITTLLIRTCARFRWEYVRTIEGSAWNDIKRKSLTSEYCDYLQFYRKNKELSEDKKERLKTQIQKGRNNSREIFVLDYEQWLGFEAKGAIKLNKIAREMMATYCPFAKEIRERQKQQPMFEEAMARFDREKLKKIREVEAKYRALQKDQIDLTPELVDTLQYLKES